MNESSVSYENSSTLSFHKIFPEWSNTSDRAICVPQFGGWVLYGNMEKTSNSGSAWAC